jgi:uncharacterized protein YeaO (DUF488 family)
MTVKTKTVYEKAAPGDGCRVLVMRYWPRGVRKDSVDAWEKALGTPPDLIKDWKAGHITWRAFSQRYTAAVSAQKDKIAELAARAQTQTVTLLCSCRDEARCHRSILKGLVERAPGGTRKAGGAGRSRARKERTSRA